MTIADRRVPPPEKCVLRYVLDRRAQECPDKVFIRLDDGTDWTYANFRQLVIETAAALRAHGVEQYDLVIAWLPNGLDAIRLWFAINYLGAVFVPINTAYRGQILEHAINKAGASLMIAHGQFVDRLDGLALTDLTDVILLGATDPAAKVGELRFHNAETLRVEGAAPPPLEKDIMPWDTQKIIYTSGTTGPSKGVLCSYAHLTANCEVFEDLGPDDRLLIGLPLFHVGGTISAYRALLRSGSMAIIPSFNAKNFWEVVREHGVTMLTLLGAMTAFLMKEPPGPDDRNHPLRKAVTVPLTDEALAFGHRFGVDIYTVFNMTETSWPIFSDKNPLIRNTCGKVRDGVEARIVDVHDREVAIGEVGELMLRTDAPWAMNHGYFRDPQATADAWRNGWFHTGDAFRRDVEGNYFFVDRIKDSIRRRGENISTYEVEAEILSHPAVREVAVIGVPSEFGEDDVLAVVAPVANASIDPAGLLEYLRPRMAYFMIPRYIRILPELPKTQTHKVEKHVLRAGGITADTWDREAAGIVVRREKITPA